MTDVKVVISYIFTWENLPYNADWFSHHILLDNDENTAYLSSGLKSSGMFRVTEL